MKKILSVIALSLLALGASAQQKGRFETHDLDVSSCTCIILTMRWVMPATS